jgi:hypothetical protein
MTKIAGFVPDSPVLRLDERVPKSRAIIATLASAAADIAGEANLLAGVRNSSDPMVCNAQSRRISNILVPMWLQHAEAACLWKCLMSSIYCSKIEGY